MSEAMIEAKRHKKLVNVCNCWQYAFSMLSNGSCMLDCRNASNLFSHRINSTMMNTLLQNKMFPSRHEPTTTTAACYEPCDSCEWQLF